MRFYGPNGYHFPRSEDLYARRPTFFIFDFDIPFFQTPFLGPQPPAAGGYEGRPVGIQLR